MNTPSEPQSTSPASPSSPATNAGFGQGAASGFNAEWGSAPEPAAPAVVPVKPAPAAPAPAAPAAPAPATQTAPAPQAPQGRQPVAIARGLTKTYGTGGTEVMALDHIDIEFYKGEFVAVMGPSGSGKSTLMHCMAGLDRVSSGDVIIDGVNLASMNARQLTALRRDKIGFIFQSFNLIPTLSAQENILLPANIAGRKINPSRFNQVITAVGLKDRLTHRPSELSGGQQQRVACARAFVHDVALVFADEPTGNLDSTATASVLSLIRQSVDMLGQGVVMVTHEAHAAAYADRVVFLADGRLAGELRNPTYESILDAQRTLAASLGV